MGCPLVQLGALIGAYDFELKSLGKFHAVQQAQAFGRVSHLFP